MKESYEIYTDAACAGQDEKVKNVRHYVEVSVPVEIRPEVKVGRIETETCGEPVVMCDECGKKPDTCRLVIAQKICIKVPLRYNIATKAGEGMTDCCGCNADDK